MKCYALCLVAAALAVQPAVLLAWQPAEADELPAAEEQAEQAEQAGSLQTLQDKASYGFGYDLGRRFRGQGMKLTMDALLRGIHDGLAAKEPAIAAAELFPAMATHQRSCMTELANKNKQQGEQYLERNRDKAGVKVLDNGLQYEVLKEGTGPRPKATDRVRTHYHGTLLDGTVFDSSIQRGQPETFGVNEVIPGWSEALQRMKVGAKWKLVIPAPLAYGVEGAPPDIGPNAVLVFELELLGIEQ